MPAPRNVSTDCAAQWAGGLSRNRLPREAEGAVCATLSGLALRGVADTEGTVLTSRDTDSGRRVDFLMTCYTKAGGRKFPARQTLLGHDHGGSQANLRPTFIEPVATKLVDD